jgi:hypothetical protein
MAPSLLRDLQNDMLLLWDRGFLSYALVQQVQARQAQLLARIKKNLVFKPLKRLGDGSYLAKFYASPPSRAAWPVVGGLAKTTLDDAHGLGMMPIQVAQSGAKWGGRANTPSSHRRGWCRNGRGAA